MSVSPQAAKQTIEYINSHDEIEVRAVFGRGSDLAGYAGALKVCAGEAGMTAHGFMQSLDATNKLLNLPGLDKKSAAFQSAVVSALDMVSGSEMHPDAQIIQALVKEAQPESLTKALSGLFKAVAECRNVKNEKRFLDEGERLGVLFGVLGGNVHTAHAEAHQAIEDEKAKALREKGALLGNPQRDPKSAALARKMHDSIDGRIAAASGKQSRMLNLYARLRQL